MILKNTPRWFLSGLMIFPAVILLGIVLFLITLGHFNILYWLVIPSIIFEELFETCCFAFSNSQIANLLFAFIFWFLIGAATNWLVGIIKK